MMSDSKGWLEFGLHSILTKEQSTFRKVTEQRQRTKYLNCGEKIYGRTIFVCYTVKWKIRFDY